MRALAKDFTSLVSCPLINPQALLSSDIEEKRLRRRGLRKLA
jgi:hypothetical protein